MAARFPVVGGTDVEDVDETAGSLLGDVRSGLGSRLEPSDQSRTFPTIRPPRTDIAQVSLELPAPPEPPRAGYGHDGDLPAPPPQSRTFFGASEQSGSYQFVQRIDTPLGETLETSFDEAWDRRSMAVTGALSDEYQQLIEDTEKATGQRLFNPYSESGFGRREIIERRERGEDVAGYNPQTAAIERFHRELGALQRDYPDLPTRSHDDIVAKVQTDRQAVRKRRADAAAGESGFLSGAAAFIGSTGAAFTDPINIVTLPLGAPWAAGILRAIAIEAGIGLASEATVQTLYQTSRSQIGERADLGEAAGDVLAVGATAGVLGGAIRGVARGVEYLSARRAALEHAETIPSAERSVDLDAAIAVERRALDVDERNPYGHDATGAAAHAERYAAAERAVERGEVVPRADDIAAAPRLAPADVAAIRDLADLARDPVAFAERVETLKATPREAVEQASTLTEFVERQGGINRADVEALGGTPSADLPRLVRDDGKAIHDVAEAARKAGFFKDTPTPARLDEALAAEQQARISRSADAAELPEATRQDAYTVSALRRAGIDLDALQPSEAAARLRTMAEGIEQAKVSRDTTSSPVIDTAGAARTEARVQAAEASTAAERQAELDAIREQSIREEFADAMEERIMIEDEDGTLRPMRVREIFEADAREASELEALHLCVTGGVRKSAGVVGAIKKVFGQ